MKTHTHTDTSCYHCGDTCSDTPIRVEEKAFCCQGCKMVYEILNENGLCTYYDLNENPGVSLKIQVREGKFAFLDDAEIASKLIQFSDGKQTHVSFYLPQIHCSSCLWLLENIHKINSGIHSARVKFTEKEVFLVFDQSKTSLRQVVETLSAIGYEPHLSLHEVNGVKNKDIDRSKIYKIGIAGFCFSNIMMMSFPEYFSLEGYIQKEIGTTLNILIIGLSLPVLFYCAQEFFTSAWKGLKNKFLNIDAPIALAILLTFGRSLYEIFTHTGSGYLDSMSGIVFFMLVGRWLQDRTQRAISFERDFQSFFPIAVNVWKEEKEVPTAVDKLKNGDIIHIYAEELIPVDAILSKGRAEIDYSFVSGESIPVPRQIGELVYAGGKNVGGMLELCVVKEVSQSYLTNLWNKDVFKREKDDDNSFIHILSEYFTYIVLALGAIAAIYWAVKGQSALAWNALTTILIVACPCALLLGATFTNGNILRILGKNQFYVRHPRVIELLSEIKHIVFDKTGTITQSRESKVEYTGTELSEKEKHWLAALLSQSNHPLSKAVAEYIGIRSKENIQNFKVVAGQGVEGWIEEQHIKIGSAEFVGKNEQESAQSASVYVSKDGKILGRYTVKNTYRDGFFPLIQQLKQYFKLSVLSGDNDAEKENLSRWMGTETGLHFQQSPEDKLNYIASLQAKAEKVLMVGDGLNDAGAFRQSDVAIAISDGSNTFTPASDAVMDASRLGDLYKFMRYARFGKQVIIASFIISLLYNVIGLYFALQGTLSPVIAAILMPCSSLTIIFFTYGMSELGARKFKMTS